MGEVIAPIEEVIAPRGGDSAGRTVTVDAALYHCRPHFITVGRTASLQASLHRAAI